MTNPSVIPSGAALVGSRRRSQRVMLVIPVALTWTSGGGVKVRERAETEVVSTHGALIRTKVQLPTAAEIEVKNPLTNRSAKARVISVGKPAGDGYIRIALELTVPSIVFWGISFPPVAGESAGAGSSAVRAK